MHRLCLLAPLFGFLAACTDTPVVELAFTDPAGRAYDCTERLHAVRFYVYDEQLVLPTLISCHEGGDFTAPPDPSLEAVCYGAARPSAGFRGCQLEDAIGLPCEPGAFPSHDELGPLECLPSAPLRLGETASLTLQVFERP